MQVWNADTRTALVTMAGHTNTINAVKWSGEGFIISASNDRMINVWNSDDGRLIRCLSGHAHWVNSLALSTEHALRTGAFDHTGKRAATTVEAQAVRFSLCHTV